MPTTYAHYRLGDFVVSRLPESAKRTVQKNRELFDIGVHGPDIFFYHNPIVKNEIVRHGEWMHQEPGRVFFTKAASVVRKNMDKEAHEAYLYGFLCHFAMDVTCHGFIGEQIEKTGISHFEIEAEFDRELLTQDGFDAVSKCLTGHLHATKKNAEVIADFWDMISANQVKQTLKRMIFFLNLLTAPSFFKRGVLFGLLKIVRLYEALHGLVINYKENPGCKETTDWLMEHFGEAVELAVKLITEYEAYIQKGGNLSETFGYDFNSVKREEKRME